MIAIMLVIATLGQKADQASIPLPALLFYLGIPIFTVVAVAVVCWIFWREKKRDERRNCLDQQSKKKEISWRNARSS